jgi:transposase
MSMSNTTKRVKEIRRKTRRKFSSEEKIRIVLEGLRGECSIAELCRREGINANLYYRWSKDFLEAGKPYSLISSALGCGTNHPGYAWFR